MIWGYLSYTILNSRCKYVTVNYFSLLILVIITSNHVNSFISIYIILSDSFHFNINQ